LQYPPGSVEKMAQGVFLTGSADAVALQTKLALLAYYLMDLGSGFEAAAFMYSPLYQPQACMLFHLVQACSSELTSPNFVFSHRLRGR